jgi:hypothetical protein
LAFSELMIGRVVGSVFGSTSPCRARCAGSAGFD